MTYLAIAAAILPALIAWAVIAILRRSAWTAHLADHPNERSLHTSPTPRVGGLGIITAVLPFGIFLAHGSLASILASLLVAPAPKDEPAPAAAPAPVPGQALASSTAAEPSIAQELAGLRAELAGQRSEIAALRAALTPDDG